MANVIFKPREVHDWAVSVMQDITEGPSSLYGASESLYTVLNRLGTGEVWNGQSAIVNYNRIKKSMLAIYEYFVSFGKTFENITIDLASVFSSLESANGASGVSFETIAGKYKDPNLTADNISPDDNYSAYNLTEMDKMAQQIDSANSFIKGSHQRLLEKFQIIDKGDDPNVAILSGANGEESSLHRALADNVENSLTEVERDLSAVTADIRLAMENAKAAGAQIFG